MNLEAVLSAVNQITAPQTPGATAVQQNGDNSGNGNFNQVLTAMLQQAANETLNGSAAETTPNNQQVSWLSMLANIFGQNADSGMLSLDPTGEATLPSSNAAVSLTEVMAALQRMATQENLTDLANTTVNNITPEQLETLLKEQDPNTTLDADTINALLAVIGAPATDTPLPTTLSQLLQQLQAITGAEQASPQAGQSLPTADTQAPQTVPTTNPASTPSTTAAFQSAPSATTTASPDSTPSPAPAAATTTPTYSAPSTTTTPANPETASPSATSTQSAAANLSQSETTNPQAQPATTVPLPDSAISAPSTSTSTAPTTFAVPESPPTTTTTSAMPDIPALHQIVKSIELINHNDKNSVRLQLHPESLGQILVHLEHSNGNVTVRMLAETVQAHNLVQDHLPQLKQAFAAQGLQSDNLSVAVGSDASAFDSADNPAQQGFQSAPQQNFTTTLNPGEHQSSVSSTTRSGSSLHTVDYQV